MFYTLSRSSKSVLYLSWIWFLPVRNVRYIQKCLSVFAVQSLSCVRLSDLMDCSTPGFPALHYLLLKFRSTHPSIHLILCHPLLLLPSIFPRIKVFSNELALCIRRPKCWSFSFSISPSNEYSVLPTEYWFPLRLTGLISLLPKGLSRVFSSTTVWKYQFFRAQLSLCSNSHIYTWLLEKP